MNPQPKTKPVRDKKYLEWIRKKECYICGNRWNGDQQVTYAHQTIPELKRISVKGTGQKDHDSWALPEHSIEHIEWEHGKGNHLDDRLHRVYELNMEYLHRYNGKLFKEVQEYWYTHDGTDEIMKFVTLNWMKSQSMFRGEGI